ncbi:hypothetical protein SAMN04488128_1021107 [Chitinophaga eiseniae]|uniref:Fimbrillin-A associated anchor protein Mfa1 and Mfa2 n=1 Tax=Chitinophaga eiseniae TaxID=634771 RepID=A0A1T4RG72_9BACT|nr:hypothetical protein [Chitinophaga eiseniae]SKA14943.1 hypothetical protein SAMN04488128_1021107 [Chitinophaga eiseniae]
MKIKLSIPVCCITLCTVLLFFSCKKNSSKEDIVPQPPAKKVAIKFQVGDFTQETTGFGRATSNTNLKDYISFFYYMAYDNKGNIVSKKMQTKDSLTFGSIRDSLASGAYTIVMMGSGNFVSVDGSGIDPITGFMPFLPLNEAYIVFLPGFNLTPMGVITGHEIFYKKFTVDVGRDSIVSSVFLARIVGKVELNILDSTSFYRTEATLSMDSQDYYIAGDSIADPFIDVRGEPVFISHGVGRLETFVLNNKKTFDIKIKGFNASNQLVASKTITNMRIEWNKKLIMKGNLASPAPPDGARVSADAGSNDWKTNSTIINF